MAKIITAPNPLLRQVSKPVTELDKKTLALIKEIEETLRQSENPKGVGLSSVQIGKPLRVFATYLPPSGNPDDKAPQIKTFINPEIVTSSPEKTLGPDQENPILEGCLSLSGIWGPVWRHEWIEAKYYTLDARRYTLREHRERFSAFPARVMQHETDHLNGILFIDHSLRDHLHLYESTGEKLQEIDLPILNQESDTAIVKLG